MIILLTVSDVIKKLNAFTKCNLSLCKRFIEIDDCYNFKIELISEFDDFYKYILFLASRNELSEVLANDYSNIIKTQSIDTLYDSFRVDFVHFSNLLEFKHNQDIKEALLEYYSYFIKNCYYGFTSIIERKLTSEELDEFKAFVKVSKL